MSHLPPMYYFTPLYKELRARSDRQMALVDAQTPLVRHLYDELLIELELVEHIITCNSPVRGGRYMSPDVLAKALSRWATTHALGTLGLPGKLANDLRENTIPEQMRTLLEAIYSALLLARTYEPNGLEDRIIRAVLDNRPASTLHPDDNAVIAAIEEDVTPFYRNGDPSRQSMLHHAVFLNGGLLQFFGKDGRIVYFNHNKIGNFHYRVCPPMLSLATAMHRLLAAFSVTSRMWVIMRNSEVSTDVAETRIIAALRTTHAQGPLTLASPQSIYDLDIRQFLSSEEASHG